MDMWETDRHRCTHLKRTEAEAGAIPPTPAHSDHFPPTVVTDIHPRVTAQEIRVTARQPVEQAT